MKIALTLLCLASALQGIAYAQGATPLLDQDDVWLLVMNIPEVMEVESRKGCPEIEFTSVGKDLMWAMVRDQCPKNLPASGTMGAYTVDLRDGHIWYDIEREKPIDSERLQRLRKVLLSRQQLLAKPGAPR